MEESTAGQTGIEPETDVLTFLIADVRGYTRFTQEHGDEAAARLAVKFAEVAREGVSARSGRLIELRGDEALAVFSSARQALRAAIDLQSRFLKEVSSDPNLPLKVGIGLDAGEAIAVEGGYRGGALNLAARLCSLAGPGEVLASEGVVHLARKLEDLVYVERGLVELKGFANPMQVIEVAPQGETQLLEADTAEATPEKIRQPIGNFLGALPEGPIAAREDELERLRSAADAAAEGNGQLVTVSGERGVGKTRLVQQLNLAIREQFVVLTGRCYERQGEEPYFSFREALSTAYAAAPASIRSKIPSRWPHLGRLLPEGTVFSPPTAVGAEEEQSKLFRSVTGFLQALAEVRPVALMIDDLQWADSSSLQLLQHLARQTRANPALLVVTYRDAAVERDHPLSEALRELTRERLVDRVPVRRLTAEGTAAMVAETIGDVEALEDFAAFVHRRTKGNPYDIEDMLRALGGRYRLVREIGAGGMGRVFHAVDTKTGKSVAAKIMFASGEADLEALLRFQQEGAVLSTLKHPNIVEVYGSFMEERASCIVMELLEGKPLSRIRDSEALPLPRVKQLMEQVASALAFAHRRSIVHRDVKPDNIVVGEDDRVKVTDFGIARVLHPGAAINTMTGTGMTMGTPLYMAPEQIEGRKVDGRADIYALGAVMYELVTGRPPFTGDDPLTVAFKHVNEAPEPPTRLNGEVPGDWEALILKALAKDPDQRFQKASTMGQAIAALVDHPGGVPVPLPTEAPAVEQEAPSLLDRGAGKTDQASVPAPGHVALPDLGKHWRDEAGKLEGLIQGRVRDILGRALPAGIEAGMAVPAGRPSARRNLLPSLGLVAGGLVVLAGIAAVLVLPNAGSGSSSALNSSALAPVPGWQKSMGSVSFNAPDGVALDPQSNIYVADGLNNRILKLSSTGVPIAKWGSQGSGTGQFDLPGGLALDRRGNIYVADTNNNRIQKLSPYGKPLKVWSGQFESPSGVAVDRASNVYVADTGNGRVEELSPNGHVTKQWTGGSMSPVGVAVTARGDVYAVDKNGAVWRFSSSGKTLGKWGSAGLGRGQFNNPTAISLDGRGNVFVADGGNNRIQEFSPSGSVLAVWGAQGSGSAQFSNPASIAVGSGNAVYIADSGNNRIQELTASGHALRTFTGSAHGNLRLKAPAGVAVDQPGNVYVSDTGNDRVEELSSSGRPFAVFGTAGAGAGQLSGPNGIATDKSHNVYVADTGNNRVEKFSPGGKLLHVWTDGGGMSAPYGIAVDSKGNIYVADTGNYRILKLSSKGRPISSWGSQGSGRRQFLYPSSVAVDQQDQIYVADEQNNRVQKFSGTGNLLASWGNTGPGSGGSGAGQFRSPTGVAVDARGDIFVVDSGNSRVQKLSAAGALLTSIGTKGSTWGKLSSPSSVTVDSKGNVYVADTGNNRIQKFAPTR